VLVGTGRDVGARVGVGLLHLPISLLHHEHGALVGIGVGKSVGFGLYVGDDETIGLGVDDLVGMGNTVGMSVGVGLGLLVGVGVGQIQVVLDGHKGFLQLPILDDGPKQVKPLLQ
jgi:hypothetical protein